jgi:hypothetical protein
VLEHEHTRRDRPQHPNVLRHQQHTGALPGEQTQALTEPLGGIGIELRRRLVEDEQRRLECQCAGERDALPFAAGQLVRQSQREVGRVGGGEGAIHARANRVARNGEVLRTDRDFFLDSAAQPGELRQRIVEDVPCQGRGEARVMDLSLDACGNGVAEQPGTGEGQRRLSRADVPGDADDLSLADLEHDVAQHGAVAVRDA